MVNPMFSCVESQKIAHKSLKNSISMRMSIRIMKSQTSRNFLRFPGYLNANGASMRIRARQSISSSPESYGSSALMGILGSSCNHGTNKCIYIYNHDYITIIMIIMG